MSAANLQVEWHRLELLAEFVSNHRLGKTSEEKQHTELKALQTQVNALRKQPPWSDIVQSCQLNPLDQDILACTLGPECNPQLGWMFQELQPGLLSNYPSQALIQELMFIDAKSSPLLHERFLPDAPLSRHNLLKISSQVEKYQPIKPTPRAVETFLGMRHGEPEIPGALKLTPYGNWDDLILPAISEKKIRELLLWLTHRHIVEKEWGAHILGGPVALFSGPSGTGKTLAAGIIANELGWPIYRVDLGILVSKYVGETEKNLNRLLDAAHKQKIVLLFDEADSLFGKRTEVKDARDRYANMEVSHLLSRIERHDGLCILTSNFRQNLDPAFARRFQVIVEFARPDAASRKLLWQKHIPVRAPVADDLDLTLVSESVKLTGGQIRNAALHAAFLAADLKESVSMPLIVRGIWSEFAKEGRELTPSRLGKLQPYLHHQSDKTDSLI